jgi:hypothetical protein
VVKNASGSYTQPYTWDITKSVKTDTVKQVGGTATFEYTVEVTRTAGDPTDVEITGKITVFNPNVDGTTVVPVTATVTDTLSNDVECTVLDAANVELTQAETDFDYTCKLNTHTVPTSIKNTVTVTWSEQFLDNGALLEAASADFTTPDDVSFTGTPQNDCATVTDPAAPAGTSWTSCGAPNPKAFTYTWPLPVPTFGCASYDNTATLTTDDTKTDIPSNTVTVNVCGPVKTGALTMGFWQNKNGQAIITGGASTGTTCNSGTWLRQFKPFQDLKAGATCKEVAGYVTNVIKAANAAGANMDAMQKAQMLATALDVYFSDPALGGNKIGAPAPLGGVSIDLTKVCANPTACTTYVNAAPAFGGATSKTVMQILQDESGKYGTPWYPTKAIQELAKDVNDAINNEVAFKA